MDYEDTEDPIRLFEEYKLNPRWNAGSNNDSEPPSIKRAERINVRFKTPYGEREDGESFYLFSLLEKYFHELYRNKAKTGVLKHPDWRIEKLEDFALGEESFKMACKKLNLDSSDSGHEYLDFLSRIEETGYRMRFGMALLIKDRQLKDIIQTAEKYWDQLTEDLQYVQDEDDTEGVMIYRGFQSRNPKPYFKGAATAGPDSENDGRRVEIKKRKKDYRPQRRRKAA